MKIEQIIESSIASNVRQATYRAEKEGREVLYFLATGCGVISDGYRKSLRQYGFKTAIKKPAFLTELTVVNSGEMVRYKGIHSGYSHTYSRLT